MKKTFGKYEIERKNLICMLPIGLKLTFPKNPTCILFAIFNKQDY